MDIVDSQYSINDLDDKQYYANFDKDVNKDDLESSNESSDDSLHSLPEN